MRSRQFRTILSLLSALAVAQGARDATAQEPTGEEPAELDEAPSDMGSAVQQRERAPAASSQPTDQPEPGLRREPTEVKFVMEKGHALNRAGSVGMGIAVETREEDIGLAAGKSLLLRWWITDVVALAPRLQARRTKADDSADFSVGPGAAVVFALVREGNARLELEVGLDAAYAHTEGVDPERAESAVVAKRRAGSGSDLDKSSGTGGARERDTLTVTAPVFFGVEVFMTRNFALAVGARFELLRYSRTDTPVGEPSDRTTLALDTTALFSSLYFYTD